MHIAFINSTRILNEIFLGGGAASWYYCTQQPDPEGNTTTVFNYSDATTNYASLAYISRREAQPPGTVPDGGIYLQQGTGPAYTQARWGDYTAVAPAGLVSGGGTGGVPTMWFAGMYANAGLWGTAIGKNGYNSITQP